MTKTIQPETITAMCPACKTKFARTREDLKEQQCSICMQTVVFREAPGAKPTKLPKQNEKKNGKTKGR